MKKKTFNQILAKIRRLEESTKRISYYAQQIETFGFGSTLLHNGDSIGNAVYNTSEEFDDIDVEDGDSKR